MKYPIDTLAIEKSSIHEWHDNFFLPLSPDALWAFNEALIESYYRLISRHHESPLGELLLIKLKLAKEYSRFLGPRRLLSLVGRAGLKPVWSRNASVLEALGNGVFPGMDAGIKATRPGLEELKRRARNLAYEFRVNGCPCYLLNSNCEGLPLWNVQPRFESMAYAKKKGVCFRYADPEILLSGADSLSVSEEEKLKIRELAAEISYELRLASEPFGLEWDAALENFVREYAVAQLEKAARMRDRIAKRLKGRKVHLLAASLSSDSSRALALIVRKNGGKVSSFNHGNDCFSDRDLRMETCLADEFCTYTKGSVELLRTRPLHLYPEFSANRPELSSLDTDVYKNLWEDSQKQPLPDSVRRVMVMGYPFDLCDLMNFGTPDTAFLHLEMKLIKSLQASGFEVLYKEHPESCCPGLAAESFGTRIIRGRFEESVPEADAFVFTYSYASIFPWTLCLNKPVALLDTLPVHRHHRPETMELLKRRCPVFTVSFDERNRLTYDEAALISYLGQKPEAPDDALVKKYMFP